MQNLTQRANPAHVIGSNLDCSSYGPNMVRERFDSCDKWVSYGLTYVGRMRETYAGRALFNKQVVGYELGPSPRIFPPN